MLHIGAAPVEDDELEDDELEADELEATEVDAVVDVGAMVEDVGTGAGAGGGETLQFGGT